ncbi:MAG TPA: biopolymer transporter ExbD [Ignavibacteriaceae bacterium]|nr:biopolymer transporter ExbD [Ignavibacteriaceae bacterium]
MRRYKLDEKEFSEINITPFTDVILVVLIIFMITSPFLITGALKVKLPQSSASQTTVSNNIEVYLNDQNQIFLNNKQVDINQLPAELQTEFIQKNNHDVIVKADKNAIYGSVVQLLDALKNAGATKLLMATMKK